MRKLKLEMEALVVETFRTVDGLPGAGTIHGAAYASGDSECPNCASGEPCTGIPIETCTCECELHAYAAGAQENTIVGVTCGTALCSCIPVDSCGVCSPATGS